MLLFLVTMIGTDLCNIRLKIVLEFLCLHAFISTIHGRRDEFTTNREFYRRGVGLTNVPDDIPENAVEVDLTHNRIEILPPNAFSHFLVCLELRLGFNKIWSIGNQTFNGLDRLKVLHLNNNHLDSIGPGMFTGLIRLEALDLSFNVIRRIEDGTFSQLSRLRVLNIKNNEVHTLSFGMMEGLTSLRELYLNHNKLLTLDSTVFQHIARPFSLSMQENQLLCDSRLCWLRLETHVGNITWIDCFLPNCSDKTPWMEVLWSCPEYDEVAKNTYDVTKSCFKPEEGAWPFQVLFVIPVVIFFVIVYSKSKKKAGQEATVSASNNTQPNNNSLPSNNTHSSNNSSNSQNHSENGNSTESNSAVNENSTSAVHNNNTQAPDHSSPPPSYTTLTLSVPLPVEPLPVVPPVETVNSSATAYPANNSRIPQTPPPAYDELFSVMQTLNSKLLRTRQTYVSN